MKVKEFFKSNVFKSLAVLLSIVIIAGALLAIFNDLLAVSEEERLERAVAKIYGGSASVEETMEITDENKEYATGTVNEAYLMSDGNYLVKTTGKGGYGGTITAWAVIECEGSKKNNNLKLAGVGKVVYESDKGETLMSNIKSSFYDEFGKHDAEVIDGAMFWGGGKASKPAADTLITNPVSGASMSAGAICNAVNTAILYFKSVILGESIGESYLYQDYIDMGSSVITPDTANKTVTYSLTVNAHGDVGQFVVDITVKEGVITAYEIKTNGSTDNPYAPGHSYSEVMPPKFLAEGEANYFYGKSKDDILPLLTDDGKLTEAGSGLHTGASLSTQSCVYAAAFATANFNDILYRIEHEEWIDEVTATVNDGAVVYSLKTNSNSYADAFIIDITVKEGVITAYEIKTNGSTDNPYAPSHNFSELMPPKFLAAGEENYFYGKSKDDVLPLLTDDGALTETGNGLHTGASLSTQSCIRAAIYALSNYEGFLAKGGTKA